LTPAPGATNAALIAAFYAAFQQRDHGRMAGCYAPDATFTDPVFGQLTGWRIGAMWRMLCERATDLAISVSGIDADAERGSAHWEARYPFSGTGRRVHNRIDAFFHFRDGHFARHDDKFSLYTWAGQALGWRGVLLGWSPPVQNAIRRRAADGLDNFIRTNGLDRDPR
jgi:ketosteroid isomerase-like protein